VAHLLFARPSVDLDGLIVCIKLGLEQAQRRQAPGHRLHLFHLGQSELAAQEAVLAVAEPLLDDLLPADE